MTHPPGSGMPSVEHEGNTTHFTFSTQPVRDEEDMLTRELRGHTEQLSGRHLVLDLTNIRGLCSVEIGTLISLHKRLLAGSGRLTVVGICPELYEVFQVMQLHTYLDLRQAGGEASDLLPPRVLESGAAEGPLP